MIKKMTWTDRDLLKVFMRQGMTQLKAERRVLELKEKTCKKRLLRAIR